LNNIDSLQQLIAWQPPITDPIISDGILEPETRMLIFGPAKSWKYMLALHTAFTIAEGGKWLGFNTKPVPILKYQVELPKAIDRKRVIKYARARGSYPTNVYFKTPMDRVKLDTRWGMMSLEKDIQEARKRTDSEQLVILFDPLYKLLTGNISDSTDVNNLQENLDELKQKYQLTYIFIHHSRLTKTGEKGEFVDLGAEEMMGSSYWNNWFDTVLRIKMINKDSGADRVEMQFVLTRNVERLLPSLEVHWSRADLHPTIIKAYMSDETIMDISSRGLIEGSE